MPPRLNVLVSSCPRARIQRSLSTTSSCLVRGGNANPITSTTVTMTTTPKGQIPPESPKFIEVPQTRQPQSIYRPWVKGVLPVPRQIFRRSDPRDKTSQEYLSAVTPDPKYSRAEQAKRVADSQPGAVDFSTWKSRQSAARRRNLREGLVELHHRKQKIDRSKFESRARKQAESLQLSTAPEREDERLTNPTVHTAQLLSRRGPLPDPNRAERVERMKANVKYMQERKMNERRAMLHTLYMNARNYIVQPAQLNEVIDRVFDDPKFENANTRGENVWHMGPPEEVRELLHLANQGWRSRGGDKARWAKELMEKRLDKIGEELTGGKL